MREVEFDSGGVGGEEKAIKKNEILGCVNVLAERLDLLLKNRLPIDGACLVNQQPTRFMICE